MINYTFEQVSQGTERTETDYLLEIVWDATFWASVYEVQGWLVNWKNSNRNFPFSSPRLQNWKLKM